MCYRIVKTGCLKILVCEADPYPSQTSTWNSSHKSLSFFIHTTCKLFFILLRDWSLITGRGGLQNGKITGPKLFAPPPQDRVKLFAPPLLKSGSFSCPPYNMAKTSSYRVKSTQNFLCPPFSTAKTFSAPPFHRGKTSRAPPSRFVAPPSP